MIQNFSPLHLGGRNEKRQPIDSRELYIALTLKIPPEDTKTVFFFNNNLKTINTT